MNDTVYKFKRYEDASLEYTGINSHRDEDVGLFSRFFPGLTMRPAKWSSCAGAIRHKTDRSLRKEGRLMKKDELPFLSLLSIMAGALVDGKQQHLFYK